MKFRLDEKIYRPNGSIKRWVWIERVDKEGWGTEDYSQIDLHQRLRQAQLSQ